jgi:hypothetical protein
MADAPGMPVAMTRALIWLIACDPAASPSMTAIPAANATMPGKLIVNFDKVKYILITAPFTYRDPPGRPVIISIPKLTHVSIAVNCKTPAA